MDASTIIDLVDNAENEAELQDAVQLVVDDIAEQVRALVNAVNDNPYVDNMRIASVLDLVHREALDS